MGFSLQCYVYNYNPMRPKARVLERSGVLPGGGGDFTMIGKSVLPALACSVTGYWFPAAASSVHYRTSTQKTTVTTQTTVVPGGPRITLVDPCHLCGFYIPPLPPIPQSQVVIWKPSLEDTLLTRGGSLSVACKSR
jgi:hypothetical protein